MDNGF